MQKTHFLNKNAPLYSYCWIWLSHENVAETISFFHWERSKKMAFAIKGRVPLPNRMNFWKKSKNSGLWPPPSPNFWKIMLQILYGGHIVWNACTCLLQSVSCFDFSQYNCWKTYPKLWIYSFCINFMLKKPCLKFPKSAK